MLNLMIIHLFGLLSPGPDFFYVVRMAVSNTHRNTVCGIIGITLGIMVWASAAILGLSLLFKNVPSLQGMVMIAGGGYLAYLGGCMMRSTGKFEFANASEHELNQATSIGKEIGKGFLVNIANAKAIVFFASIMSLILVDIVHFSKIILALGIIAAESFVYFYVVARLFAHPFAKQFYQRYALYIDRFSGAVFILFAVILAYHGVILLF